MKIVVTGGAGYVGSFLISKLALDGHDVYSIDDLRSGSYDYLTGVIEPGHLVVGDIRDVDLMNFLFQDADVVVHLAAIPGLVRCDSDPKEAISVNVYGTYQVLEVARRQGVRKVVFASSSSTYGSPCVLPVGEDHSLAPMNLYGVTKFAGEELMRVYYDCYGVGTIRLRFGNIYGVGLFSRARTVIPKFVKMALQGADLTIYGDGSSTREYVHVDDVVQAIARAAFSSGGAGEAYNVGSQSMAISEVAAKVSEAVREMDGMEVGCVHLPERPGETKRLEYDFGKISSELGYEPTWDVDKGIKQLIGYFLRELDAAGLRGAQAEP